MSLFCKFGILVLAICLFFVKACGQGDLKIPGPAVKRLEETEKLYRNFEWEKALKSADRLLKKYPSWSRPRQIKALILHDSNDMPGALSAFYESVRLDSTGCPECWLMIAQLEFSRGQYARSLNNLMIFRSLMVSGREKTAFDRLKQSVDFALGEVLKPDPVFPEKVTNGINTSMDEYFPSITVDGSTLIFTRQEWLFSSGRKIPGQEDLFQISWKAGETRFPLRFDYPVNTPGNEGTVSVRQDGRTMLFTACNRPDSKGGCDIYLAVRTGEVWEKPYNLGYPVNTRYWESTPFLAADGLTLYFSSNRPGGRGGMDLWKSSLKNDGSWTEPVNLGPVINTEGNEIAPFMLPEGTNLYFASDGHPGMGGFDLFRSGVSGKAGWEIPVNLGYPVNTWHNEEGITMPGDPEFAIISSDRDSLTGKDLYLLKLPREKRPPKSVVIRGIVQNALDGSPVGAEVEIVSLEGENSSRVVSDEISGEYLLGLPVSKSYRLNVNRQGFLFYSGRVLADTIQSRTEIQWDILLQPIRPGASITLNNIYFALDSYELLPESGGELTELTRLLKDNPSMLIEICGHTDSTGSREYNLELSRKRAESVMNHLVMQGIDSKRLSVRGFGDSRPVADNDTEEGRSKNRRTEVRIL